MMAWRGSSAHRRGAPLLLMIDQNILLVTVTQGEINIVIPDKKSGKNTVRSNRYKATTIEKFPELTAVQLLQDLAFVQDRHPFRF
jgi:hypothetical protein